MVNKICCTCKIEKDITLFNKHKVTKDGYNCLCRECSLAYNRKWVKNNKLKNNEYHKKYSDKNKKKIKIYRNQYKKDNKEKIKMSNKKYYLDNKEFFLESSKNYRENNPDKVKELSSNWKIEIKKYSKYYNKNNRKRIQKHKNEYNNNRKKNDPVYNLRCSLARSISDTLREKKFSKKSKTCDILGCSFQELKEYLETKFESWMNWSNKGNTKDGIIELNKTWDVDHIIPLSTAKTEEDIIRLNHYTNLQPLCSYVNRYIKRAKYVA